MIRKKTSKRQSLSQKFKIQHKAVEHRKKLKKLAKKNPGLRKSLKDPGIPNSWPFKDEMLEQAEREKEKEEELRAAQKEKRSATLAKKRRQLAAGLTPDDAKAAREEVKRRAIAAAVPGPKRGQTRRKWYWRELRHVLDTAHVVVEVVDVRDPIGGRTLDIERLLVAQGTTPGVSLASDGAFTFDFSLPSLGAAAGASSSSSSSSAPAFSAATKVSPAALFPTKKSGPKPLILLLNKIDLVPPEVVTRWLEYFNARTPTFAFKSTMPKTVEKPQKGQVAHLVTGGDGINAATIGADSLLALLKSHVKSLGVKRINVVVVGGPNSGKSSVINSLFKTTGKTGGIVPPPTLGATVAIGGGRVGVSSVPESTRLFENVRLSSDIELVDTPAPPASLIGLDMDVMALRNFVNTDLLPGIPTPVGALLRIVPKEHLMQTYKIATFEGPEQFLVAVAMKKGKVLKGGRPDLTYAAKAVLRDWNQGVIPWCTRVPETPLSADLVLPGPSVAEPHTLPSMLSAAATAALERHAAIVKPITAPFTILPPSQPVAAGADAPDDEVVEPESGEDELDDDSDADLEAEDDDEEEAAPAATGAFSFSGPPIIFGAAAEAGEAKEEKKKPVSKGAAAALAKKKEKAEKEKERKQSGKKAAGMQDEGAATAAAEPVLIAPPAAGKHTKAVYASGSKKGSKKPAAASAAAYDFSVLDEDPDL